MNVDHDNITGLLGKCDQQHHNIEYRHKFCILERHAPSADKQNKKKNFLRDYEFGLHCMCSHSIVHTGGYNFDRGDEDSPGHEAGNFANLA